MADDDDRSLGQTVSDTQRQVQKGKDDRKSGGLRGGLKAAGSSLSDTGRDLLASSASERITPVSMKRGGKVRKAKRKKNRAKSRN